MLAPFLLRRLLALALTVLIAISLTFLSDTGPSFLSPDIPVQQVLWEGLRVDLALLVGGTAVAAAWALPC